MTLTENNIKFGWRPSSIDKRNLHYNTYRWNLFLPLIAASVEKSIPVDPNFYTWYEQDAMNACVAASWSKLMAVLNTNQGVSTQYSWKNCYEWCCDNDGDPQTTYKNDVGTFLWAGGECYRTQGAYVKGSGHWDIDLGLASYYWCHSIDDIRTAISLDRPLAYGLPWFSGWMSPVLKNGKYWIPARNKWGNWVGNHAISGYDALDSLQGAGLNNTWLQFPEKVFISYTDLEYLMNTLGAEVAAGIDKDFVAPTPDPTPVVDKKMVIDTLELTTEATKYKGANIELAKV